MPLTTASVAYPRYEDRRLRVVYVERDIVFDLLRSVMAASITGKPVQIQWASGEAIPWDAELVDVRDVWERGAFAFLLHCPGFSPVPPGERAPEFSASPVLRMMIPIEIRRADDATKTKPEPQPPEAGDMIGAGWESSAKPAPIKDVREAVEKMRAQTEKGGLTRPDPTAAEFSAMVRDEEIRARTIHLPSTGNADEDDRRITSFLDRDKRLKAGLCPNGCEVMPGTPVQLTRNIAGLDCPNCGFHYGCTPVTAPSQRIDGGGSDESSGEQRPLLTRDPNYPQTYGGEDLQGGKQG